MAIFLVIALLAAAQLGIGLFSISMPAISVAFHAPPTAVKLALSVYFLTLGLGQFIYGPLSDSFGRKPILLFGTSLFCSATLLAVMAPSIQWLIIARFLEGLGMGCAYSMSKAVVMDKYQGRQLALASIGLCSVLAVVPVTAPLLGVLCLFLYGWQGIFILLFCLSAVILLLLTFKFTETNYHRHSCKVMFAALSKSYQYLFQHRQFIGYTLAGVSAYGILASMMAVTPFLLIHQQGMKPSVYALLIALMISGFLIVAGLNAKLKASHSHAFFYRVGYSILIGSGLIYSVLAYYYPLSPVVMVICLTFSLMGMGFVMPDSMTDALAQFKPQESISGRAASVYTGSKLFFGAFASFCIAIAVSDSQFPFALGVLVLSLFSCGSLWVLVPSAFMFPADSVSDR